VSSHQKKMWASPSPACNILLKHENFIKVYDFWVKAWLNVQFLDILAILQRSHQDVTLLSNWMIRMLKNMR
jgi:hypothetical protein